MQPIFIILAAGMGTRLGREHPKALTILDNGESILGRQVENIQLAYGKKADISVVVGYKMEYIIEQFPDVNYIFNEAYETTNTSKSLLKALRKTKQEAGVIWMNGDVVFSKTLLPAFKDFIETKPYSTLVVNTKKVGEEEIKYVLDPQQNITHLSKQVKLHKAYGESIGVNYVKTSDRKNLELSLGLVEDQDYFEKGIEVCIRQNGSVYKTFDITKLGLQAVEVDSEKDLTKANVDVLNSFSQK